MNQNTKNTIRNAATIAAYIVGIYAAFKALTVLILILG